MNVEERIKIFFKRLEEKGEKTTNEQKEILEKEIRRLFENDNN